MRGPTLTLLVACLTLATTACSRKGPPLPPLDSVHGEPVRYGVTPGVFLLSEPVPQDQIGLLLGRAVMSQHSGAATILSTLDDSLGATTTAHVPEFDGLAGIVTVNRQVAIIDAENSAGLRPIEMPPRALWTNLSMRFGEPAIARVLQQPPTFPPGTAYVSAVLEAPWDRCHPEFECSSVGFPAGVAVLVTGVGGPPGQVRVSRVRTDAVELQVEVFPWTRVVIHIHERPSAPGRPVWNSSRYSKLGSYPQDLSLESYAQRTTVPFSETVVAALPPAPEPTDTATLSVTFIDWTVPDLSADDLTNWERWVQFVEGAGAERARMVVVPLREGRAQGSPP